MMGAFLVEDESGLALVVPDGAMVSLEQEKRQSNERGDYFDSDHRTQVKVLSENDTVYVYGIPHSYQDFMDHLRANCGFLPHELVSRFLESEEYKGLRCFYHDSAGPFVVANQTYETLKERKFLPVDE